MLSYYMGEARHELVPPEVDGRSRIVSKDMMDTIEWIMPSLMRMFASSDDVIRFEPEDQDDEQAVSDATEFVSYLFFRKNDGFRTLHDAIKNCLIQRQAVIKVFCDESWDEREEKYEGVSQIDLQALGDDPDVEVVDVGQYGEVQGEQGGMEASYDVTVRRREQKKQHKAVGVPPEEMRFNKTARSIEDARFVQQRTMRTVSDLHSLGYDPEQIKNLPSDGGERQWSFEEAERGDYDNTLSASALARLDDSLREIELCETYIKVDFDGNGIAEFRRVVHAGTVVFENEVTDDHPFALFCPILMPYKAVGLGMWDLVEDLQRIRTFLTRQMIDNAALANSPRTTVVEGQVMLDDLLNPRVNGIIRVKSLDAMRTEVTPFVGGQVLTLLDHFGQARDKRTGVTEFNQGLGADSLSKTQIGSEGAQSMMDAAMQRVEMIARVLAETGITRVWKLLLKSAVQYADRAQEVKVNGRWLHVNPREWKNSYDTVVSVGIGTSNKQQKIINLRMIGEAQERALPLGLATPENIFNTLTQLAEAMGYRDGSKFFTSPDKAPPKNDGPPPEIMLEQMKQQGAQQLAQVKAQADIQVEQMRQTFQGQQAQQETQLEAERNQLKMQSDMELEAFKVEKQGELEMLKAQLQQETTITVARINAEAKILSAKTAGVKDGSTADADADYQEQRE